MRPTGPTVRTVNLPEVIMRRVRKGGNGGMVKNALRKKARAAALLCFRKQKGTDQVGNMARDPVLLALPFWLQMVANTRFSPRGVKRRFANSDEPEMKEFKNRVAAFIAADCQIKEVTRRRFGGAKSSHWTTASRTINKGSVCLPDEKKEKPLPKIWGAGSR